MHEHATEVQRLVGLAFPTLPVLDKETLSMDYFTRSLDNKAIQRHMLAIKPASVAEAVQAAEDFVTVSGSERGNRSQVMHVDDEGVDSTYAKGLATLTEAVQAQTALLMQLVLQTTSVGATSSQAVSKPVRKLACYQCGGAHFKRNCPLVNKQPGNGRGPAQ